MCLRLFRWMAGAAWRIGMVMTAMGTLASMGWQAGPRDFVSSVLKSTQAAADSDTTGPGAKTPAVLASAAWHTWTVADGLPSNDVRTVHPALDGTLWVGTHDAGIAHFDGKSWTTFTVSDGVASNTTLDITEDADGRLWCTGHGISVYDGQYWRAATAESGLPGDLVFSVTHMPKDQLWFSTDRGVCTYRGGDWLLLFDTRDGLPDPQVHAVRRDSRGQIWFATAKGLACLDGTRWSTYMENRDVRGVLEDPDGNLWFGTSGHGAVRFDGSNWTTFVQARTLVPELVDRHSRVWFSSERGGAFRADGDEWTRFDPSDGLASTIVFDIAEDRGGNLWFATAGGVSRLDATAAQTLQRAK